MRLGKFRAFLRQWRQNLVLTQSKTRAPKRRRKLLPVECLESRQLLSGTWSPLNATGTGPGFMEALELLPDGSVMVQAGKGTASNTWYELSPKSTGNTYPGTATATGNYI